MLNWCRDQDECLFLNKTLCWISKAVAFTSGTSLTEQPTDNGPLHHYCLNNDVILRECKAALFGCRNILMYRNTLAHICCKQTFCYLQTSVLGIFLLADFLVFIEYFLVDLMLISLVRFCLLLSNILNNLGNMQAWFDWIAFPRSHFHILFIILPLQWNRSNLS